MRILFIASGFLPEISSEGLCNAKLVWALKEAGIEVDVISKIDNPSVSWHEKWQPLKSSTTTIQYPLGNKIWRTLDILKSGIRLGFNFQPGIRWARRALEQADKLITQNHYDAMLTRSPNDITHLVGYYLKKKHQKLKWIANWNDPAYTIWPHPYGNFYTKKEQVRLEKLTESLLKAADINTFPCRHLQDHFFNHFPSVAKDNSLVIPHIGIPSSLMRKPDIKRISNKLRFLHSGVISGRNPENLFIALRRIIDEGFDNFEMHVMGRKDEVTSHLIGKYRLQNQVKCIGNFHYFEAVSKMFEYDILVLLEALLEKGIFFASKTADYAYTQLPVFAISPKDGFAKDLIDSYGGYFADNKSSDAIYDTLSKIITDFKEGRLENSSSKKIADFCSPHKVIEIYANIISIK